ncbi:MAG TPA: EAL domain-containing protein, partial [Pusillimonas sp.]
GTGYSNLKSVRTLSPDVLKIDKSFIFELEDATLRSNLIPEIVNIARAINAQAVAEGIENIEQARLLAQFGVQYGQGYALARPMELESFLAFMAAKS